MAFTFGTKAQINASADNPIILSFTCAANTRLLVISILGRFAGARTGGAPTYNSVEMTQAGSTQIGDSEATAELWYMVNPPTGSAYDISVPNGNTWPFTVIASSYIDASVSSAELDVYNQTNVTQENPSLAVTTNYDGEVIIDAFGSGGNSKPSGNNQTLLYSTDEGVWNSNAQYALQGSAGEITFSWTIGSDDVAFIVAAFRGVSGGTDVTIDAPCIGVDSQALASGLSLDKTLLPPLVAVDSEGKVPTMSLGRTLSPPIIAIDSDALVASLGLGLTLQPSVILIDSEALIPIVIVPGGVTIDIPLIALTSQGLTPSLALDKILNSPLIAIDGEAVTPGLTLDKIFESPTALISSEALIHKALIGVWRSPTSYYDPDSVWSNEENAYDENTSSYAETEEEYKKLELHLDSPIACDRVRFWATMDAFPAQYWIRAYYNDEWHNVTSGWVSFANPNEWIEVALDDIYLVSKVSIEFRHDPFTGWFNYARLHEFDFGEIVEVLIRPPTPSISSQGLVPSLLRDAALIPPVILIDGSALIPTLSRGLTLSIPLVGIDGEALTPDVIVDIIGKFLSAFLSSRKYRAATLSAKPYRTSSLTSRPYREASLSVRRQD